MSIGCRFGPFAKIEYLCLVMISSRTYHSLHLDIASQESDVICYILLHESLDEKQKTWLFNLSEKTRSNLVVISGFDWNNDLTPWKAEGIKTGEKFGGKAEYLLQMLQSDFFVNIETSLRIKRPKRYICGVSLSGLFALWSSMKKELFTGVASISGSFWYDGFTGWIKEAITGYTNQYFFSLGKQEKNGKNARMATVETATLEIVELLKSNGKEVIFEMTEGGHFSAIAPRLERAITSLLEF